jgi:hypothetical protein
MIVYAVVDDSLSRTSPLGDAIETFIRREDAERFIEEVRGEDPEVASYLRSRSASRRHDTLPSWHSARAWPCGAGCLWRERRLADACHADR